eukprot:scaffold9821_cov47-Attheya_sp.AAC.3
MTRSLRSGDEKCCVDVDADDDAADDDADDAIVCKDEVDVDRFTKYKLEPNAAALTDMNNDYIDTRYRLYFCSRYSSRLYALQSTGYHNIQDRIMPTLQIRILRSDSEDREAFGHR